MVKFHALLLFLLYVFVANFVDHIVIDNKNFLLHLKVKKKMSIE